MISLSLSGKDRRKDGSAGRRVGEREGKEKGKREGVGLRLDLF